MADDANVPDAAGWPPPDPHASGASDPSQGDSNSIETLFDRAEAALAAIERGDAENFAPFVLEEFSSSSAVAAGQQSSEPPVEVDLEIQLGRIHLSPAEAGALHRGVVLALEQRASEPVEIHAHGRVVARAEVLVMNDRFCFRVTELVNR